MSLSKIAHTAGAAALAILVATSAHAGGATISAPPLPTSPPEVCYAPNTDRALVEHYTSTAAEGARRARNAAGGLASPLAQISDGSRWSWTATNGSGLQQGDPTTITWSIVPDGTAISGAIGEPAAPSNLRARLNAIYGSEASWLPLFQQVFDRWSELTGITYVYQPTDDGVALFNASGQLGVRGDVRIGGHAIDGNFNVLAYNYYPNNGDMVIDTNDSFFTNTSGNSLRLRNTIAHEHGHGLGFAHSCPINQTKLMEPMLSTSFDGPQHDDVYGGNRAYGDDLEHNDVTANASDLGSVSGTVELDDLSVDDNSDSDHFRFVVGANSTASVTVTPVGATYLMGAQNSNGSCSAGTSYNTLTQNDLAVQIVDRNGITVLASASAAGVGAAETLSDVALSAAGAYYLRVAGGSANTAQLYRMSLTVDGVAPQSDEIFSDGFDGPTLNAWDAFATGNGDLSTTAAAAMAGARGLQAVIDDMTPLYVEDESPDSESRYRVRFSFDPNGFTPGTGIKKVHLLKAFTEAPGAKKMLQLSVRRHNGQYQMVVKTRQDGTGWRSTGWIPFSDAEHSIEIDWQRATSDNLANGRLELWLDGTSVGTITGVDNAGRFLGSVKLGLVGVRASTSGIVYFDRFESRRTSYIGP